MRDGLGRDQLKWDEVWVRPAHHPYVWTVEGIDDQCYRVKLTDATGVTALTYTALQIVGVTCGLRA